MVSDCSRAKEKKENFEKSGGSMWGLEATNAGHLGKSDAEVPRRKSSLT